LKNFYERLTNFYQNIILPIILIPLFALFLFYILWRLGSFNIIINYVLLVVTTFYLIKYSLIKNMPHYEVGSILWTIFIFIFVLISTIFTHFDIQVKDHWQNLSTEQLNSINKFYLSENKLDNDSYILTECLNELETITYHYKVTSENDLGTLNTVDENGIPVYPSAGPPGDYGGYISSESIVNVNQMFVDYEIDWYWAAQERISILNDITEKNYTDTSDIYLFDNTIELCNYWYVFHKFRYQERGFIFDSYIRNIYLNR
jgi:hypothetical protein